MHAFTLVCLVHALGSPPVAEQQVDADVAAAREVSAELKDAQAAHLWRVAGWGAANVGGGTALMASAALAGDGGYANEPFFAEPGLFGVGVQAAGWGAINLGIVAVGAFFLPDITDDLTEADDAEATWRTILLVNEGLNVGYVLMGAAILAAGFLPVPSAHLLQGHGLGIMFQGMGLIVLDGVAYLEAYQRKQSRDEQRRAAESGEDTFAPR